MRFSDLFRRLQREEAPSGTFDSERPSDQPVAGLVPMLPTHTLQDSRARLPPIQNPLSTRQTAATASRDQGHSAHTFRPSHRRRPALRGQQVIDCPGLHPGHVLGTPSTSNSTSASTAPAQDASTPSLQASLRPRPVHTGPEDNSVPQRWQQLSECYALAREVLEWQAVVRDTCGQWLPDVPDIMPDLEPEAHTLSLPTLEAVRAVRARMCTVPTPDGGTVKLCPLLFLDEDFEDMTVFGFFEFVFAYPLQSGAATRHRLQRLSRTSYAELLASLMLDTVLVDILLDLLYRVDTREAWAFNRYRRLAYMALRYVVEEACSIPAARDRIMVLFGFGPIGPSVPARFWSSPQYLQVAEYIAEQGNMSTGKVLALTAAVRQLAMRQGVFVGWVPFSFGIHVTPNRRARIRQLAVDYGLRPEPFMREIWGTVPMEIALWCPAWEFKIENGRMCGFDNPRGAGHQPNAAALQQWAAAFHGPMPMNASTPPLCGIAAVLYRSLQHEKVMVSRKRWRLVPDLGLGANPVYENLQQVVLAEPFESLAG